MGTKSCENSIPQKVSHTHTKKIVSKAILLMEEYWPVKCTCPFSLDPWHMTPRKSLFRTLVWCSELSLDRAPKRELLQASSSSIYWQGEIFPKVRGRDIAYMQIIRRHRMDSNICGFLTPFSISQYVENIFLETTNTFYLRLSTLIVVPTHFFYHR